MNQVEQNIDALIKDLPIIVSDLIIHLGLDAKALIQRRVQETGQTADGVSTGEYSLLYKKKREKKGRQTSFVDLTDTGDMWQSIGYTDKRQDSKQTVISIAGRDAFAQNKINWNSEKKFEVLKLSKGEEEILQQIFEEEMTNKMIFYLERGV